MKLELGGPPRYAHQREALHRLIETRGVCALLMDPGTGKTAPTLDYLSALTLKSQQLVNGVPEVRVLIVSPKAATDNWPIQARRYLSPQINYWAEVLGGSIAQKGEALMSRGPRPYAPRTLSGRSKVQRAAQLRGLHSSRAELIYTRGAPEGALGPSEVVGDGRPRLILLSTNLDTFASRARRGSGTMADYLLAAVKAYQPDVLIIDEMHKLKGHGSNTSRLIGRVAAHVPRRIGLTGTVMPAGPMDVFGQWRFIDPYAFGTLDPRTRERKRAAYSAFESQFGVKGGFMGREVVSYRNLDQLQSIMAKSSIVVKKEDALDLPKMTDTEVFIQLDPHENRVYQDMKQNLAAQLGNASATVPNRLTQLLRLRQITAGHLPDDQGEVQTVGSSKVDAIHSLTHDTLAGEKRIVIFALFRHEIEALRARLAQKGTEVQVIDGTVPAHQRLAIRRRFGDLDAHPQRIVLIAQVQTISLSVNELVTASHAIFASLSQRRDDLVQARDRLNRIGQTLPCTFWYVLAKGTVDEVIYASHQRRTDLEAAILRHVLATTNDEPAIDVMSGLN